MDLYLVNKIDSQTFCDEFYYCYGQELDRDVVLSENELLAFEKLDLVSGRFSQFEEDHKLGSNVFLMRLN